jgi:hypothetical protein
MLKSMPSKMQKLYYIFTRKLVVLKVNAERTKYILIYLNNAGQNCNVTIVQHLLNVWLVSGIWE